MDGWRLHGMRLQRWLQWELLTGRVGRRHPACYTQAPRCMCPALCAPHHAQPFVCAHQSTATMHALAHIPSTTEATALLGGVGGTSSSHHHSVTPYHTNPNNNVRSVTPYHINPNNVRSLSLVTSNWIPSCWPTASQCARAACNDTGRKLHFWADAGPVQRDPA